MGDPTTYSGVACLWGRSDLPGLTPRTRDTLMPRWKFGYVRQLSSGRWQPGHHGPDGHRHTGSATLANAIDAERWLVTTQRLPTWEGAFDNLGEPAHVSRPGVLVDIKGLLSGTVDSDRPVRCLCIYLTKDVADTYSDEYPTHAAGYERHVDRLHSEIQTLPCSPGGTNGNRYRVTSNDPERGMVPGRCSSPAHHRENLGLGGRRVLVSRLWSGKTLPEHGADRRAVVAEALPAAGIDPGDADQLDADRTMPDGTPNYVWEDADSDQRYNIAAIAASLPRHGKGGSSRRRPKHLPRNAAHHLWTAIRQ